MKGGFGCEARRRSALLLEAGHGARKEESSPVMRREGSYTSIFSSRSSATGSISGRTSAKFCGRHFGKDERKSGMLTRAGHTPVLGVPSRLLRTRETSARERMRQRARSAPEDLEDLVNLRVSRDERHTRLSKSEGISRSSRTPGNGRELTAISAKMVPVDQMSTCEVGRVSNLSNKNHTGRTYSCSVVSASEQHAWRPVPEGDDLGAKGHCQLERFHSSKGGRAPRACRFVAGFQTPLRVQSRQSRCRRACCQLGREGRSPSCLTFKFPDLSMSRFCGLRSRCRILLEWR